jgi:4-hydroxy-2-oxoheptanedioate aldolase
MRTQWTLALASMTMAGGIGLWQAPKHFNPTVDVLAANKPLFGIYAPANPRRGRGGRGGPPGTAGAAPVVQQADAAPVKSPTQLAQDAMAYNGADYIFDGSMEGDFDAALPSFTEFAKGVSDATPYTKTPYAHLHHPIFVKTHKIAENPELAKERIAKQLNLGVSGVVFVEVESAEEVKAGLAAMRFKSNGGTRPDEVGSAPAMWGMSDAEYRQKADLWPLNPRGELVNFTIVESRKGLEHVREIAQVKGIGVLFPGAGTLGGVFSSVDSATGRRVRDDKAWEAAIQQVLAACKEFHVPCGYPANTPEQVTERMKQGFTVFISGWGDAGFKAIEEGKKIGGR